MNKRIPFEDIISKIMEQKFPHLTINDSEKELLTELVNEMHCSLIESFEKEYENTKKITKDRILNCVRNAVGKTLPENLKTSALTEAERQLKRHQSGELQYDFDQKKLKRSTISTPSRCLQIHSKFINAVNEIKALDYFQTKDIKLDFKAKEYLGIYLYKLTTKIAFRAAQTVPRHSTLEYLHIQDILHEFLENPFLALSHEGGYRSLDDHAQELQVFTPKRVTALSAGVYEYLSETTEFILSQNTQDTASEDAEDIASEDSEDIASEDANGTSSKDADDFALVDAKDDENDVDLKQLQQYSINPGIRTLVKHMDVSENFLKILSKFLSQIAKSVSSELCNLAHLQDVKVVDPNHIANAVMVIFPETLSERVVQSGILLVKKFVKGNVSYRRKRRASINSKAPSSKREKISETSVKIPSVVFGATSRANVNRENELDFSTEILNLFCNKLSESLSRSGSQKLNSYLIDVCKTLVKGFEKESSISAETVKATVQMHFPDEFAKYALQASDNALKTFNNAQNEDALKRDDTG